MQMLEFIDILFIYSVDCDSMLIALRIVVIHSDHRHQSHTYCMCAFLTFTLLLFTYSSFHINQVLDLDSMLAFFFSMYVDVLAML